jgi:hypothetical protein
MPSPTDLRQLAWVRQELEAEGLPALMAIAADDGKFSFVVAPVETPGNDTQPAARKVVARGHERPHRCAEPL